AFCVGWVGSGELVIGLDRFRTITLPSGRFCQSDERVLCARSHLESFLVARDRFAGLTLIERCGSALHNAPEFGGSIGFLNLSTVWGQFVRPFKQIRGGLELLFVEPHEPKTGDRLHIGRRTSRDLFESLLRFRQVSTL